jgi:trans-aconitate methyltransferase
MAVAGEQGAAGSDDLWEGLSAQIDTSVAHPARMYDYYLGGKDNYEVDRETAERFLKVLPEGRAMARANRAFLGRVVRMLAAQGIRQFLDIGTGIPGPGNTNDVAHEVAPDARIVYVDNDPIVITHARALLARPGPGLTTVIQADLREPETILEHPEVRRVLDFSEPVAVLMVAVLNFIRDTEDPQGVVDRVKAELAPGSYLAITQPTADFDPERANAAADKYKQASAPLVLRSRAQLDAFFAGFDYVEPGLVQIASWHPDGPPPEDADKIWIYGGVGRKP